MSFEQRVWQEMSRINVNQYTHKKGNLTYLAWADCWKLLCDYYPESTFDFGETVTYPDDSVEVWASVTIKQADSQFSRKMPLPVMDHRNNAIKSPSSRQISDARMRALVKAVAVATGLGLYLYQGESVPSQGDEKPAVDNPETPKFDRPDGISLAVMKRYLKAIEEIINDPQGKDHDPAQILQEFLVDPEAPEGKRQMNDLGKYIRQEFIESHAAMTSSSAKKGLERWGIFISVATNLL